MKLFLLMMNSGIGLLKRFKCNTQLATIVYPTVIIILKLEKAVYTMSRFCLGSWEVDREGLKPEAQAGLEALTFGL